MKMIISLVFFLGIFSHSSFAAISDEDIPHYKIYPRTPAVDYKEDHLDFYSVKDLYGEFSNFALFPIIVEGKQWPSSEHFYQSQKFLDPNLQEKVRTAASPYLAAQMGRDPNLPLRKDWEEIKEEMMSKALHAKFTQYKILQTLLLSTKKTQLYEHTKNDCYWADCGDRSGKNKLGQQLMQVRDELARDFSNE